MQYRMYNRNDRNDERKTMSIGWSNSKTYVAGGKKVINDESCSKTMESDEKRKVCGLNNNIAVPSGRCLPATRYVPHFVGGPCGFVGFSRLRYGGMLRK